MNNSLTNTLESLSREIQEAFDKLRIQERFRGLTGLKPEEKITIEELQIVIGICFTITDALSSLIDDNEIERLFDFTGECFEYLHNQYQNLEDPINDFALYASINYSRAKKFANSTLLAKGSRNSSKVSLQNLKDYHDIKACVLYYLDLALERNFRQLKSELTNKKKFSEKIFNLVNLVPEAYKDIIAFKIVLDILNNFADLMIKGAIGKTKEYEDKIARLEKLAQNSSNSFLVEVAEYLNVLFFIFSSSNALNYLREKHPTDLPKEYLRVLVESKEPIYELWPSQTLALEHGLLEKKYFSICMPTSSGKTLLAEFKIASVIGNSLEDSLCIYVAPSNALAKQVQRDLQERLKKEPMSLNIKVLTGTYIIEDEDLRLQREEDVIITTPEKLDGLLRNSFETTTIKQLFDRCKLFIFDECHTIEAGKRGITYEFLIARLKILFPQTNILTLSAAFPNVEEISEWISGSRENCVKTNWKPTRLDKAMWMSNGTLRYWDAHWNITGFKRSGDSKKDVAQLAINLQKNLGNILVMVTQRKFTMTFAKVLLELLKNSSNNYLSGEDKTHLQKLSNRIRDQYGEGHKSLLAELVEFGICYHHSHLPATLKSILENEIRHGVIKFVFSTTTLAEGLNFPVRCVILPNIYFAGDAPISPKQIQNIIGRAGRALRSTSGTVVVFQQGKVVRYQNDWIPFEQYCFDPPDKIMEVKSSLNSLLNEKDDLQTFNILDSLDSQILGMMAEGSYYVEKQADFIANKSFVSQENTSPLAELIDNRLIKMSENDIPLLQTASPYRLTEYGGVLKKTGFGTVSCERMRKYLEEIIRTDSNYFSKLRNKNNLDREKIERFILAAFQIPDNIFDSLGFPKVARLVFGQPKSKLRNDLTNFLQILDTNSDIKTSVEESIADWDIDVILNWINGESPLNMYPKFIAVKTPNEQHIEEAKFDAVHYCEAIQNTIGWSIGAVCEILYFTASTMQGVVSRELYNMPYYLKHGVSSVLSVALLENRYIKINRDEANKLAESLETLELSYHQDRQVIEDYLSKVERELILETFIDTDRAQRTYAILQKGIS